MRKFRHPAQLVPKWAALPAASSSSATTAFYHSHSQGGALPASTSSSSFAPAPHATRLARPDLSPASKGRPLDAIPEGAAPSVGARPTSVPSYAPSVSLAGSASTRLTTAADAGAVDTASSRPRVVDRLPEGPARMPVSRVVAAGSYAALAGYGRAPEEVRGAAAGMGPRRLRSVDRSRCPEWREDPSRLCHCRSLARVRRRSGPVGLTGTPSPLGPPRMETRRTWLPTGHWGGRARSALRWAPSAVRVPAWRRRRPAPCGPPAGQPGTRWRRCGETRRGCGGSRRHGGSLGTRRGRRRPLPRVRPQRPMGHMAVCALTRTWLHVITLRELGPVCSGIVRRGRRGASGRGRRGWR